jgi:hypothetical protein
VVEEQGKHLRQSSSCWLDDIFFYTPLYFEVNGIRAEVEDMEDDYLVDEVSYLGQDDDEIDQILYDFITVPRLTEKDRQKLINFYVICSIEDYLVMDEFGEIC